ncbi:hypothetical protein [Hyphomonas sp.]|uniref:hypothetical protein n=1 Tax=Hyphomonas sp. TaxID=87 RepID=UPI0032FBCEE7
MTRQLFTHADRPRPGLRNRSGNIASLMHILSTGNLRTAAAMLLAGIVCVWTCVQKRATGKYGVRRRQVLLLTCKTSRR